MNKKNYDQKKSKILEKIKWYAIPLFFFLSFFINYYYETPLFIHVLIISCITIYTIKVLLYKKKGQDILSYIKMSQKEMQKIIWPKYKETLYTTFIVISITIFISLILWGLDSIIFRLIAFIISLRF